MSPPDRTFDETPPVTGRADLHDESLAAVIHLTGPGAAPLLGAAVAELGGAVRSIRLDQVSHEPGTRCTVAYRVDVDWGGHTTTETLVATTSTSGPPAGAAIVEADGLTVGLWRYPFDPELPGLAGVVMPTSLERALGHLLRGPLEPTVLTYRPGRRAVVRVTGAEEELYVKVLRPSRAQRLAVVHQRLFEAGVPVPELIDADLEHGVLVLRSLGGTAHGVSLRSVLVGENRLHVPGARPAPPIALHRMLSDLSTCVIDDRPARRHPLVDVVAHLAVLRAIVPEQSTRLDELRGRLRCDEAGDHCAIGAGATVHGDLHDGQIMVDRSGVPLGLLDLDDVGIGARADDLGNLLGHALTLAIAGPRDRPSSVDASIAERILSWAGGVRALSDAAGLDHAEVTRRAAGAVVSLSTGPFRVREDHWRERTSERLAVAERLLGVADLGAAVQHMRTVSEPHHRRLIPVGEN